VFDLGNGLADGTRPPVARNEAALPCCCKERMSLDCRAAVATDATHMYVCVFDPCNTLLLPLLLLAWQLLPVLKLHLCVC